ncbi:MAG: PAS domain S-box protein, partial [Pyrinomonadaceae bacterium]
MRRFIAEGFWRALVSADGQWLQVNRSLCGIVGYSEEKLLGMDFQSITHIDDLPAIEAQVGRLLGGDLPACQLE